MTTQAVAVNRAKKYFRMDDDSVWRFCAMLDINGNDTENPDECIIASVLKTQDSKHA